jgi:hypothetical protein
MKKLCPGSAQLASCYSYRTATVIDAHNPEPESRTEDTQTNLNLKECKPECAPWHEFRVDQNSAHVQNFPQRTKTSMGIRTS